MKARALILTAAAILATEAARAADSAPDPARVERMAASAAERFEGCCRGQAFDRAALRALLRERSARASTAHTRRPVPKLRQLPALELEKLE